MLTSAVVVVVVVNRCIAQRALLRVYRFLPKFVNLLINLLVSCLAEIEGQLPCDKKIVIIAVTFYYLPASLKLLILQILLKAGLTN